MKPVNNIRTKIEIESWARRVLIDAMLAGIPFATLGKSMSIDSEKLSAFACFGARVEESELKRIVAHMGEVQDMEASVAHNKMAEVYGDNPHYRGR